MRKVKVCELVFDTTVYPRPDIDSQHVSNIVKALEAGTSMPPLVVEKKTLRVVDGFHRGKGYLRLYGKDHLIDVVEKTYKDDKELLKDAARYNSSHGRNLTSYDRAHCALRLADLGADDEEIGMVLHMTAQAVGELRVDRSAVVGKLHVPIKRTIRHMAGKKLTPEQQKVNERSSGMNQVFYANQLIDLIESELLDDDDKELMGRLLHLRNLINGLLPPT